MPAQIKSYKFKLKPTKEQWVILNSWLGATRFMYNLCLDYKTNVYTANKTNISKNDIQKELKEIKNETSWMKNVHSQVIQDVTDRLFVSYDNFFRRVKQGVEEVGFPKFAKKNKWSSFKFKQGVRVLENTNKISLPKIGKIKFIKSQDIIGDIRTTSIKKEYDGWYVVICCEVNIQPKEILNKEIGLDLGLKELVITSDGEFFYNPKTLKIWEKRLETCHRNLSRKKKGSKNRKKNIIELQKLYAKISAIRKDYLHKTSSQIVNENQVIVCEKLNIQGMLKNHKLAKSISDAGWGMLVSMLEYKSKWAGRTFIQVAAHYTSQDCNVCGYRNSELTLKDREWTCPECNTVHDRDINASINILNKGIKNLTETGHVFDTLKHIGDMECNSNPAEEPTHTKV
jgi:putative transposase